jgi:transcriptional regulator with XRE-family HTH domain
MSKILSAIRKAIEDSDQTRYQIAQAAQIAQSQLSRFMSGERGLSVEAVEKLADHLELEIQIRPKRKSKRGK